jgi:hypothetical protein
VDEYGGDTCHHCKGDTWHTHTNDVAGMTCGRCANMVSC